MVWLKRRFLAADYASTLRALGQLQLLTPASRAEFQMASVAGNHALSADYYISLPDEADLAQFSDFELVSDDDLPKKFDRVFLSYRGSLRV